MKRPRIVVIGGGVSGLTTAVRLLEAGADVLVRTAAAPVGTASAIAGAMIGPMFGGTDEVTRGRIETSDRQFRLLATDPGTGVRIRQGRLLTRRPTADPRRWWAPASSNLRSLADDELPAGFTAGAAAGLPFVDMPVYLSWLTARLGVLGGRLELRPVLSIDEITADQADVVVNCAGLGAVGLAGDTSLTPIWGQHVIVDAPWQAEFIYESGADDWVAVMPHDRRVILGGVRRPSAYGLVPDPAVTVAILERCRSLLPELRTAPVVGVEVGLRPARPTVRLERPVGGRVVHNYGHGGNGVMLSWGCADAVTALALR